MRNMVINFVEGVGFWCCGKGCEKGMDGEEEREVMGCRSAALPLYTSGISFLNFVGT